MVKMIRTVRYELPYDKALVDTVRTCTDVFNYWADLAFEHNVSNKNVLHDLGYHPARERFPLLQSQLFQTVRDTVCEARKAAKTRRGEENPVVRAHPGRGLRYNERCLSVRGGKISISTIEGRKKYTIVPAPGYEKWLCRSATLNVHKKRVFLHCEYQIDAPPVKVWTEEDLLGIDRGIKNIVACSDNTIINSKQLRNTKGKYQHAKAELQSKGTRSAKRRFIAISGRERRFVTDVNHCISKLLIGSDFGVFVLEDLTNIRKNSVKGKMGKRSRKMIGGWVFRQLQMFLEYKAEALGKLVIYVDPKYTSQKCSHCGHTEKNNRKGHSFRCVKCDHSLNADLNASRNIAELGRTVFGRVVSQGPVCSP